MILDMNGRRKYGVTGNCIKKWIIYYENRK